MNAERAERLTVTKAGIAIGCAWTAPPPRDPGSHAEAIQSALLTPARRPMPHEAAMAAAARLFAAAVDAWHDCDLRALYLAHRRARAGRWQSFRGALRCWTPF